MVGTALCAFAHPAARLRSNRSRPGPCIGGHGTDPYEQNTQQSPLFGRSPLAQPVQS